MKLFAEWDRLEKAATPGPWFHGISAIHKNRVGDQCHNIYDDDDCDVTSPNADIFPADADFIAFTRTHIRKLLNLLEAAAKETRYTRQTPKTAATVAALDVEIVRKDRP